MISIYDELIPPRLKHQPLKVRFAKGVYAGVLKFFETPDRSQRMALAEFTREGEDVPVFAEGIYLDLAADYGFVQDFVRLESGLWMQAGDENQVGLVADLQEFFVDEMKAGMVQVGQKRIQPREVV